MTDLVTHQLIGVSRDTIEEALKSLQIIPEVLAKSLNAMWDILLGKEVGREHIDNKISMTPN